MRVMKLALGRLSLTGSLVALCLVGCASKPPDVININGLIPITDTKLPDVRAYQAPTFERAKYHGICIDPTTLYSGPDADFGHVAPEDRQRIAAMLTSEMRRVLAENFHVVNAAGPGIVRLSLTLVGINESHPVLSTALRLTPVGLVMSAGRTLREKPAAFVGSINMAGVAYDSETGQVLIAVQAIISPAAIDVTSGVTPLRAAELSTTRAAEALRDYLLRTRGS
jgi:Protein of unknown function (DUF3313)